MSALNSFGLPFGSRLDNKQKLQESKTPDMSTAFRCFVVGEKEAFL